MYCVKCNQAIFSGRNRSTIHNLVTVTLLKWKQIIVLQIIHIQEWCSACFEWNLPMWQGTQDYDATAADICKQRYKAWSMINVYQGQKIKFQWDSDHWDKPLRLIAASEGQNNSEICLNPMFELHVHHSLALWHPTRSPSISSLPFYIPACN